MLLEWLANRNVGPDGAQLDPSRTWQPELFRAVRDRIAERYGVAETSSQRLATALELIRSGELSLDAGARPRDGGHVNRPAAHPPAHPPTHQHAVAGKLPGNYGQTA